MSCLCEPAVPMAFQIEPASSSGDLAATASLFQAYAASIGIDLSFQDFDAELAGLPGKYAPPSGAIFLARSIGGEAIGCVALRPLDTPGCSEMKRLYVSPSARSAGLGRALVERIVAEAARLGYADMRLDTLPTMTQALALYEDAGFVRIPPYYDTPVAGTVFLALKLRR